MKIRLTPQLAYVIGLWKCRRSKEGIGIEGGSYVLEAFVAELVSSGVAKPNEIKMEETKAYTYHTAYRAFFDSILKREDEVFKYNNDYSASFFAGLFDAVGGERAGKPYLARADNVDEVVLLRLNFRVVRTGRILWIGPAGMFMAWIRPYRKVEFPVKPEVATARSSRGKVERRPRRIYPTPPPK